jgi:hypothetical protein
MNGRYYFRSGSSTATAQLQGRSRSRLDYAILASARRAKVQGSPVVNLWHAREEPAVAITTTISDTVVFVAIAILIAVAAAAMVASNCSAMA